MTQEEQWLLSEKYDGVMSESFQADVKRLAEGVPLAYVIGYQPFLGLKIYLDSHPLIPRPETEWWVDLLLSSLSGGPMSLRNGSRSARPKFPMSEANWKLGSTPVVTAREEAIFQQKNMPPTSRGLGPSSITFLDLCSGSGAIGCAALAQLPNAEVYFGEIDRAHEQTILKNIRENNLDESRAHIGIGDLFAPFSARGGPASGGRNLKFDVIATNPPYIPVDRALDASVTDYEPALALRSGSDGLDLIRRIVTDLPNHLTENGVAWIEVDSSHANAARGLFEAAGLPATIRTDQFGAPRLIVVSLS